MKIKSDELKYVANLARIKIDDDQLVLFSGQLNKILEYIDKLRQLDTKKIEPMSHVLDISNVYRKDTIKDSFKNQDTLKNAPESKKGFFKVPKVIE